MKTISNVERVRKLLVSSGLKPTYQRLKVLEYLHKHKNNHPTVEMIYEALAGKIPTISMTTIYNTLNALLDKGLVSAETITGSEVRYDSVTNPHHHFLCLKCGKIIDIDIKCPLALGKRKTINGHRIKEVHGYFKGLCEACYRKAKKRTKQTNKR